MQDALNFSRQEAWMEMVAPGGRRWKLGQVPDWVFDYLERGEDIPLDGLPWGVPIKA